MALRHPAPFHSQGLQLGSLLAISAVQARTTSPTEAPASLVMARADLEET